MKEEQLIFIVSQPRAGSTYLQNLLSNNESVSTTSEHWLLLNFANQFKPTLSISEFDIELANDAFSTYLSKVGNDTYREVFKKFILSLYGLTGQKDQYVLDKTPRYYEILNPIKTFFPKAKIIILKRNPIEVLKSIINTWEVTTLSKLEYYKRDLLIAPKALSDFSYKHRSDPNVYTLKYEDLIADQLLVTKELYKWLEIPFDNQALNVDSNLKIKGKYGDPYQSGGEDYKDSKGKANDFVTGNSMLTKVIEDYETYLGQDFLNDYGNYLSVIKQSNTLNYPNYFNLVSLSDEIRILKHQLSELKNSNSFKVIKYFASLLNTVKDKVRVDRKN